MIGFEFGFLINQPDTYQYNLMLLQLAPRFSGLDQYQSFIVIGFSPGSINVRYRVTVGGSSSANINDVSGTFEQAVGNDLMLGNTGFQLEQTDIHLGRLSSFNAITGTKPDCDIDIVIDNVK